jgi:hypothetical protein
MPLTLRRRWRGGFSIPDGFESADQDAQAVPATLTIALREAAIVGQVNVGRLSNRRASSRLAP